MPGSTCPYLSGIGWRGKAWVPRHCQLFRQTSLDCVPAGGEPHSLTSVLACRWRTQFPSSRPFQGCSPSASCMPSTPSCSSCPPSSQQTGPLPVSPQWSTSWTPATWPLCFCTWPWSGHLQGQCQRWLSMCMGQHWWGCGQEKCSKQRQLAGRIHRTQEGDIRGTGKALNSSRPQA